MAVRKKRGSASSLTPLRKKKKVTKASKKKTVKKKASKYPPGKHPNQLEVLRNNAYQKGESGNPSGRPKGSKNLKTIIGNILERELTATELNKLLYKDKKTKEGAHIKQLCDDYGGKITYREAMILRLVVKAVANGDEKAVNAIFDREVGKPSQTIHNTEQSYEDYLDGIPEPEEND